MAPNRPIKWTSPLHVKLTNSVRHHRSEDNNKHRLGRLFQNPSTLICIRTSTLMAATNYISDRSQCQTLCTAINQIGNYMVRTGGCWGGHWDESLLAITLQVLAVEIKRQYPSMPHLSCLNLTAKSFATSVFWCQRDRLIAQRQLRQH